MKKVKVTCPKCGNIKIYKNYFDWILHTPFHWFGKRRIKCKNCGIKAYVKKEQEE